MKALIINKSLSDNFGDQLIGLAIESLCRANNIECDSVDLTNGRKKDSFKTDKHLKNINRKKHRLLRIAKFFIKNRKIARCVDDKKYDLIIIGGGELLQDNNSFPIALHLWTKHLRKRFKNVPIVLFGIGAAENYYFLNKFFLKKALRRTEHIYVRDNASKENLLKVFDVEATEIPDVVFSLYEENLRLQRTDGKCLVGITSGFRVNQYSGFFNNPKHYYDEMVKTINGEPSLSLSLIYNDSNDLAACRAFLSYYSSDSNNKKQLYIEKYETLEELIDLIKKSERVISPRMHSCIMGLLFSCEVTPVLISQKMNSFRVKYLQDGFRVLEAKKELLRVFKEVVDKNYGRNKE